MITAYNSVEHIIRSGTRANLQFRLINKHSTCTTSEQRYYSSARDVSILPYHLLDMIVLLQILYCVNMHSWICFCKYNVRLDTGNKKNCIL